MTESVDVRDKLEKDLAEVTWRDLRFHLQKDVIILVADNLDLVEVAVAVTSDNKDQVSTWIAAGKLNKPSQEQIAQWEAQQDKPFRMLIAQPYILSQAITHA